MGFFNWLHETFGGDANTVEYTASPVEVQSEPLVLNEYEPEPPTWHNDFGTAPDYSVPASFDYGSNSFGCGNDWPSFE